MSNLNNNIEKTFLMSLKKAYQTYDVKYIKEKIAEDFTYESFWVFATMEGADNYVDYLTGKLATQKKNEYKADFCIVKEIITGKPLLLVASKKHGTDYPCFVAEVNEVGLICSLNILPASFYKWEPDDEKEFDDFYKRNKD